MNQIDESKTRFILKIGFDFMSGQKDKIEYWMKDGKTTFNIVPYSWLVVKN